MIDDVAKSHREVSAEHERRKSHHSRLIEVNVTATSLRRRRVYERDIVRWLKYYFAEVFTNEPTPQQRKMAEAILHAARFGGDQAIAAPRGDGKTTITECVVVYCVLMNLLSFPLILAATGPDAERILANIKGHLEDNDRLLEDYNEVCGPIRELDGLPNRANGQLVKGKIGTQGIGECRTRIKWAGRHIHLPIIKAKHSRAQGAIIATRGLDAAVRGIKYGTRRPDLAVIDDPETREMTESLDGRQRDKLQRKIDQDVVGLAGPNKRLARVMLTTLMRRDCVSALYTDQDKKPSWHGVRFRMVQSWPSRTDLWEEYIARRQTDQHAGDKFSRGAHAYYLEHRAAMDDGVIVGNPWRFVSDKLPDGTQLQVSTIQYVYDLIADIGLDSFNTEYQNDPPEETGPIESGITAHRVQMQVSGYPRKMVPPGCTVITQGIDVGKFNLHWVVRAWKPDATGYVIDYGVQEVHGTTVGSDYGVDVAIARAIKARMSACHEEPYCTAGGEIMSVDLTLIDSHYRTDAVYGVCKGLGLSVKPAMGIGAQTGPIRPQFRAPVRNTTDRQAGDGWFQARQRGGVWLVNMDTNRWKTWEHDRWMTATDQPGTLFMWGEPGGTRMSDDQKQHHAYAHHIVAEVEVETVRKGVLVREWKAKSDNNHWLDASYMSDVAANMKGIRLVGSRAAHVDSAAALTLAEMAAESTHG